MKTALIIVLILYPVINFLEAWLEEIVILMKDAEAEKYHRWNKQEHSRSAVFAMVVCLVFLALAALLKLWWLLPAILINRRLVFDYALKHFRNRPLYKYEGDGFFDTIGRRLFGEDGGDIELIVLLLITIFSLLKSL